MSLCERCQAFDIRDLLLASASQKPEATKSLSRTLVDANDFKASIPEFHPHHETIVALKQSAQNQCPLCELFWQTWVRELTKKDFTEEWLNLTFPGQIYLGCSSWTSSSQGFPYIILTQRTPTGHNRTLCSFEAFAEREDLPDDGETLVGRAVSPDSSLPTCISTASDWLRVCLKAHDGCGPTGDTSPLPTRVIDVGDEERHPKLVTTNGKLGTWIALSYCWGGDSEFVFTDKKQTALLEGIPIGDFPPTLRDAVLITRQMGIPFVWIDALCIKQDSAEDWEREAAKMKDVYAGAVMTVIASNSPSTHSGIFSKRKSGLRGMVEWRGNTRTSTVYLRPGNELWDHSLQTSPLVSRGWTLQEGLLAPRTLSFGSQQMIWECSQYQADEGGRVIKSTEDYRSKGFLQHLIQKTRQEEIPQKLSLLERVGLRAPKQDEWWKSYSIANPYDRWNDISAQFTSRSLTKDYDVLPALSGIAAVFQSLLKDTYCAGLWKREIRSSLGWARSPRYPADNATRFDLTKKSGYLAPSWSWASIPGKISSISGNWKIRDALQTGVLSVAKIISVHTVPAGPDPFGKVLRGELVLRGRYCKIEHLPPIYSLENQFLIETVEWSSTSAFQRLVYDYLRTVDVSIYERYQQHEPCPNQEFGVIELAHYERSPGSNMPGVEFLLLESTGEREGEFRRFGHLTFTKSPLPPREDVTEDMFLGISKENDAYDDAVGSKWKKRTLTIV